MPNHCRVLPGRWALLVVAVAGCRFESEVARADAAPPDVSVADASAPDASTPDASAPNAAQPGASAPDASLPDAGPPSDAATDCGDGSAYTLLISGEQSVDPDHVERMRCTFFEIYPQLARRFNPAAPTTVGMVFTDEPGVAWAAGTNTYYNRAFLAENPRDSDVVVHETMHIVQSGYAGDVPSWIIEGTADYVRDAYGLHNGDHGWALPTGWVYGPHYLDGYAETAAFMKWIDENYRAGQAPVVDALDDILRLGRYSSETFVELTGLDLEALWYEYSDRRAPQPASSGVTLFQDIDYTGRAFTLAPGAYDSIDLQARGLSDVISSLQVPRGRRLSVFADADFSGESALFTSDTAFVGGLNDLISSLVVD